MVKKGEIMDWRNFVKDTPAGYRRGQISQQFDRLEQEAHKQRTIREF